MKIKEILNEAKRKVSKWVVYSTNKTPKNLLGINYETDSEEDANNWNIKTGFNGKIKAVDKFGITIPKGSILK